MDASPATVLGNARFELDAAARWTRGGRALCGGDPLRLFRFSERGAEAVRLLGDGCSIVDVRDRVGTDPSGVARRLVDAGVLHPRPESGPYQTADVTVVVPVRDRAAALARLLDALHPTKVAVIVVDDGSSDGSGEVAEAAGATVIRRTSDGGPATARNAGLQQVASPVVAFVDSDCLPEGDWLEQLLPHFVDPRVAAVAPRVAGCVPGSADALAPPAEGRVPGGGKAVARHESAAAPLDLGDRPAAARPDSRVAGGAPRATAAGRYDSVASPLDMGSRPAAVRPGTRVGYVPAAVLVVRREAIEAVGGFDEELRTGEDVDLVWRLAGAGWTVRYVPSVVVTHEARSCARELLERRFAYGTAAAPLSRRHPGHLAPLRAPAWSLAAWAPLALRRLPLPVRVLASATVLAGAADALAARLGTPLPFSFRRSSRRNAQRQERQNPALRFRRSSRRNAQRQERKNEVGLVLELALRAHVGTLRSLGDAIVRPYAPLSLLAALRSRTGRRVLLAAAAARVATGWWPRRHDVGPTAFAALRLADDFAYSAGVWWGCAVHRTIEPLVPQMSWGTARP